MSRPSLIFIIAILALSQGTLWAQNAPYTTRPNIDVLEAPIEIRVAEDVDNYINDDEATQALALARPSVATNPGNRATRTAESTAPALDSAIANAALELTSENWFANYDVALGNDTLTPSLETSLLPLEIPGYDFQWNDLPAIATTQRDGAANEFEDVVLSPPSYETRSTVIKQAGTELLPIEEFELSRTLVDQPISGDRIAETTIVNPLMLTSEGQPSPSDRTFADQRLSTERISTQSAIATSQTSQQYVRGFNPKTDRRRLVAAQAQRGVPQNRTQRTSGLGWLFMPILAVPLAWFGVQHYRKQKAMQLSLVGCGSCDLTHLQCDDCPEKSESTRQQREAESQTMHYQRSFRANSADTCESGSVGVASNDFSESRRRASSAPSTGIAASAAEDRTFGRQSERPTEFTEDRYETRKSSCSIPAQRSQEFETTSAEQGDRFESQQRAPGRRTERETVLENNTSSSTSRDDLTRIYGIGPATSEVLRREGIKSFSDVAATDSVRLESILEKAGNRFQLINPTTWPTQAEYAESGDWEGLETWRAAELESMEGDSEFAGRGERFDREESSRENFGEFEENDCDQEVAVLEDANSLLASVNGIRREFASFDEIEEAGYDESSYDQYDSEERRERTSNFRNQRDGEWSQVEEDDLTEIRGIGAATQELLRDNGIRNFGDLLDADVNRLQDILDRAGSRFQTASPAAWIEHARDLTRVTQ